MNKTLYVFDMDNTLLKTPTLFEIIKLENGKVNSGIGSIDNSVNYILDLLNTKFQNVDSIIKRNQKLAGLLEKFYLKKESNNIYLYQNNKKITKEEFLNILNNPTLSSKEQSKIADKFQIIKNNVQLKKFSEFYRTEGTIGVEFIKRTKKIYENAQNKLIVTGRSNSIRKGVEYILFNYLGLEHPNYGLYLYNGEKGGIAHYKAETIKKTIEKNNWKVINLYEDKKDWIVYIKTFIEKEFPKIIFNGYLIVDK